ncbi:hypothetical protein A2333_01785 [Candidatus Wolfebacteria bacterium RIFOXYB2_FULL_49_7]|uniref:DNA polymerase III subunit delta n=1 Tax=Candidatus Wolfebacteria bacterium RIFOXYB1_FULL_54_12 TaxID=1802559 RepID=A0A1F8DV47_9BACT|nr:MAG: hypothetical protein A2372_00375 [Candidatus Wolfebacteria bacterium RIFOXYB1_FULL_54_12]OGM94794.1 MAG: hypothetical protein A2333_01785 [Candidatus Wolfebacteria bacterium RIFOXYB2_FULL_49_7]
MDFYKKIEKDFKHLIDTKALFHAYVFFGEDEAAIMEFTKRFAQALEHGSFDGEGKFLNDFLHVVPFEKESIGIDEVRAVQNFLYQRPVASPKRMVVMCPADAITDEGQSALLKIIEEPPKDALIILVAHAMDSMMQTIRSRVHEVYFPAADQKGGEDFFSETLGALRKHLDKNAALAHEIIRRKMAMDRYNLNKPLQMRLLEGYAEQYGIAKKTKLVAEKRKTRKKA